MYAITSSSCRVMLSADDLMPGESAVDAVPAAVITAIAGCEIRSQRDALLRACDWTQQADAALTSSDKLAWATYRQALRDVPAQTGFPDAVIWPAAPTLSDNAAVASPIPKA